MAGRHRAKPGRWKTPSAIAAFIVCALVATLWLTGMVRQGEPRAQTGLPAAAAKLRIPDLFEKRKLLPVSVATTTPATSSTTTTTPPSTTTATSTTPERATQERATQERATQEPDPTTTVRQDTAASCSSTLKGTRPHVARVGHHLMQRFDITSVGGVSGRAGGGDHAQGLALDLMVDTATGNTLADYVLAHQSQFGVKYVIWRQRINMGSGWEHMEGRGSPTANHYDHVHVSFKAGADVNVTC